MFGIRLRRILLQAQVVALGLSSAFMAYTALGVFTNCKSPVVVVLSGSMEPGIHRGDLLILSNYSPHLYHNGEITVYEVPGQAIPIVHRVVQTHTETSNDIFRTGVPPPREDDFQTFLTKGDNNEVDDVGLYRGPERLQGKDVVGKVRCIIPFVGYVSILFNEYPRLRYGVFTAVGLAGLL
ncbi:signal peptidase I [Mycena crocata]|nr:signal peptidase I [Mycena crocata]